MSKFDQLDAALDAAQQETFGDTGLLNGVEISLIKDDHPVYLMELGANSATYSVVDDGVIQITRGTVITVGGIDKTVSRIHPKDGNNYVFELE